MEHAQPLTWSDSFAVGHAEIDSQHRALIDAINEVEAAARDRHRPEGLARSLNALRAQALRHIAGENALLRGLKSGTYLPPHAQLEAQHFLQPMAASALDQHMARHHELLARLDAIIAGEPDELYDALKSWFVDHAVTHDLPLKAIFQAV
jgi:hemerythrin